MHTFTVTTTKNKKTVARILRDLPLIIAGKKNDLYGVRNAFWSGFAHSMYVSIFRAYQQKSRLSKDELGNSWPDISPQTKAYRRAKKTPGRLGLLSSSQRKEWWKLYKKYLHYFINEKKISLKQSKSLAAKKAWVEIKKQGGQTKLQKYANQKFPVLIDKGNLLASLTPGAFNGTQYNPRTRNQIFTITRESLKMGSRVRYAEKHHEPKEKNFPQRRLWPKSIRPWVRNATIAGALAVSRQLARKI